MTPRRKTGRPRIEDRAKTIEARSGVAREINLLG
jgi:hypothetical protein